MSSDLFKWHDRESHVTGEGRGEDVGDLITYYTGIIG